MLAWLGLYTIIIITGCHGYGAYYDTDMIVNMTLGFASAYNISCIRLLSENGKLNDQSTFDIYKGISVLQYKTAAVYPYDMYLKVYNKRLMRKTCFKPIKLILDGAETKEKLVAISHKVRMSNSLWLVILNTSITDFLSDVRLTFDVELIVGVVKNRDLVEFQEVYRVDENYPLRIKDFGKWTRSNGLEIPMNHLYERRSDLEGKLLRVGSIENWPMSSFMNGTWDGYFPRIWKEVAKLINSTTKAYRSRDNATGSLQSHGSWNGLVGMILDESLDAIAAEISINQERSKVVSFTRPVLITKYKVYLTYPGHRLKWDAALQPLAEDVWIALLIWILVATFCMAVCCKCSRLYGTDANTAEIFTIKESFFFVLQSVCQQGYPKVPRSSACRIVILACFLVSSVLIPSYSASVISSLTHEQPERPFDTLKEMLLDGSHKLLVIPSSGQYDYFKSAPDPLRQKIWRELINTVPKEHQVKNIADALEKAFCKLDKYAFFSTEKIFNMKVEYNPLKCPLVALSEDLSPVYQSFVLPKNSSFTGVINYHLQRLFDCGIISRIENSIHKMELHNAYSPFIHVDMEDMIQIFVFLICGLILSMSLLLIEKMYVRWHKKKCMEDEMLHNQLKVLVNEYPKRVDFYLRNK